MELCKYHLVWNKQTKRKDYSLTLLAKVVYCFCWLFSPSNRCFALILFLKFVFCSFCFFAIFDWFWKRGKALRKMLHLNGGSHPIPGLAPLSLPFNWTSKRLKGSQGFCTSNQSFMQKHVSCSFSLFVLCGIIINIWYYWILYHINTI